MASHKVGGEVDAFCTKCRMTLAHTILAMVGSKIARVQCNTCRGQHAYRTEAGSSRPAAPRAPQPRKEVISFDQRLAEKDPSTAKPYSPKTAFAVDELLSHPTFGLGLVLTVRQDKIDVAFKAFEKTLVHGRGEGAAAAKPAFAHPKALAAPEAAEEGLAAEAAPPASLEPKVQGA